MEPPRSRVALVLLLLFLVALTSSCESSGRSDAVLTGTYAVRYDPIEGGCWGLVAEDNTVYRPINLDNTYRINGLRVRASVLIRHDMVGFCPGASVEIIEITTVP